MLNRFITKPADLVTTYEQTRAGFLSIALEKNLVASPYVQNALAFRTMIKGINSPDDLLKMPSIRPFMLAAAGLSDKSLQHLTEADQNKAISELIEKFLKPAGENYAEETIYRYLLIKGDAVGGMMRNRIGALGQEKLIRALLSCMNVQGMTYQWMANTPACYWAAKNLNDVEIEKTTKALFWQNEKGPRILAFNMTVPAVRKNVDICLFEGTPEQYNRGRIVSLTHQALMLGELKGGIDPAGADEHWKTANAALERIRHSLAEQGRAVLTSFVGAAIAAHMAEEIFAQLQNQTLTNAANLTDTDQLTEYCSWLLSI